MRNVAWAQLFFVTAALTTEKPSIKLHRCLNVVASISSFPLFAKCVAGSLECIAKGTGNVNRENNSMVPLT